MFLMSAPLIVIGGDREFAMQMRPHKFAHGPLLPATCNFKRSRFSTIALPLLKGPTAHKGHQIWKIRNATFIPRQPRRTEEPRSVAGLPTQADQRRGNFVSMRTAKSGLSKNTGYRYAPHIRDLILLMGLGCH
jgi:hypothetical protein